MQIFLNSPEDYHDWNLYISTLLPAVEWRFYSPNTDDTYSAPRKPQPSDVNPAAVNFVDLSEDDRTAFMQLRQIYRFDQKRYMSRMDDETRLCSSILSSVRPGLRPLNVKMTYNPNRVRELLTGIRDTCEPLQGRIERQRASF